MFTVLRRFSIPMTMLAERRALGARAHARGVRRAVATMIAGAAIAAGADLAFDARACVFLSRPSALLSLGISLRIAASYRPLRYAVVLANDALTAGYGVATKLSLSGERALGRTTLLLYNSLAGALAVGAVVFNPWSAASAAERAALARFDGWRDPGFCALFCGASVAGALLNYAIFACTQANSALTTTVVGCLKNVLTSYVGMVVGGDYRFSVLNFCGLNVSIAGSLLYTYATFRR